MKNEDCAMKDLVKFVAESMVDNPEQVEVSEVRGQNSLVLELRVAKTDIGKIIGKHGRNVKAIRDILSAASAKIKMRTTLEILE